MSAASYQRAQKVAETPRETEYRLFALITGRLVAAREQGLKGPQLADALHRNREMWSTFADNCGVEGNLLPEQLRASIISVALWVNRHTSDVIQGKETLDDLISVNRNVMAGLAPQQLQAA